MDHLTALKVFRHVVELQSFAEASRQLGLSPAAISKNIGELEAHLGVRLLNRNTRRMSRTEAGSRYYEYVARILDELEEAGSSLGALQQSPSGVLRVSAPMTLALTRLSTAMPKFLERHPKVEVDLHLDSRRINLVEEGFDLAIRMSNNLLDSTLIAKKLMAMQQVVCGSPAFFAREGVPTHPSQLQRYQAVQFSLSGHVDEWTFRQGAEEVRVPIHGRYKVTSSLAVRDALLGGFGLSLLPRLYVEDTIRQGQLRTVLDDWASIETSVYAVYPSRRFVPPKVRAFIDFVVEELGAH